MDWHRNQSLLDLSYVQTQGSAIGSRQGTYWQPDFFSCRRWEYCYTQYEPSASDGHSQIKGCLGSRRCAQHLFRVAIAIAWRSNPSKKDVILVVDALYYKIKTGYVSQKLSVAWDRSSIPSIASILPNPWDFLFSQLKPEIAEITHISKIEKNSRLFGE